MRESVIYLLFPASRLSSYVVCHHGSVRWPIALLDSRSRVAAMPFLTYDINMSPIEFEADLHGEPVLAIPPEVAAKLPKSGRATVLLLVQDDQEDREWQRAAYEQFMKDDSSEDSVYDAYQ
jgi:hypothetical protein